jgi:hypothetical protein
MAKPFRAQTWHGSHGTRHGDIGGAIKPKAKSGSNSDLLDQLGDIQQVSQGVPAMPEETVDRARRIVIGSEYMAQQENPVELCAEIFDMLGLRLVDQDPTRTLHKVTGAAPPQTKLGGMQITAGKARNGN